MRRNYLFLLTSCLLAASYASAQEKPAVLRCIFKGSVELHSTLEPSSPVIANIPCGTAIILVDHRSSSPHVRTKDGKDGYIISFNGGQWSVQPELDKTASKQATPPPAASIPDPPRTEQSEVSAAAPDVKLPTETVQQPVNERPPSLPLTNKDIADLIQANVSSDVVIALIESSKTNFDTAPTSLAALKKMNVPDTVLLAMVRAEGPTGVSKAPAISKPPLDEGKRSKDDLTKIFRRLQTSVVTVWSEFGRGTGFIIEPSGLILTNEHVIGSSVYIAVQSDSRHKALATLVAANADKDIAVLWTNLQGLPGTIIAPLPETKGSTRQIAVGEPVVAIGSSLDQRKVMTTGVVRKVEPRAIIADIDVNRNNSGGPVVNSIGEVIGIASFADAPTAGRRMSSIIRIEEAEPLVADAHGLISQLPSPPALSLPIDPVDPFPIDAVRQIPPADKFDPKVYSVSMGDFELLMITPMLKYRMQSEATRAAGKVRDSRSKSAGPDQEISRLFETYGGWREYVGEYRPVLHVQVSPETGESLWSIFNRTLSKSGVVAPARQRFKTNFFGMRLLCGGREVQPIHPGKIAHVTQSAVSASLNDAVYEGLYSYAADAISPSCGQVTVEVFAEKNREKPTVKVLDNKFVERIAEDFALYLKSR